MSFNERDQTAKRSPVILLARCCCGVVCCPQQAGLLIQHNCTPPSSHSLCATLDTLLPSPLLVPLPIIVPLPPRLMPCSTVSTTPSDAFDAGFAIFHQESPAVTQSGTYHPSPPPFPLTLLSPLSSHLHPFGFLPSSSASPAPSPSSSFSLSTVSTTPSSTTGVVWSSCPMDSSGSVTCQR